MRGKWGGTFTETIHPESGIRKQEKLGLHESQPLRNSYTFFSLSFKDFIVLLYSVHFYVHLIMVTYG